MFDRGFFLTLQAIRRQLAAMPYELYLVRLIHQPSRRPAPGERLWTATQLTQPATVRFLRGRNREGCDIFFHPYAQGCNAGYIFLDLDHPDPVVLETMRANGHEPCVVLQSSPGHLQAWIRVSAAPLAPAVATAIGKQLAHLYQGDWASTDWRHVGRLAGFTNQKPQRRTSSGYAPWVKVVYAQPGWAPHGASLIQAAQRCVMRAPGRPHPSVPLLPRLLPAPPSDSTAPHILASSSTPSAASNIYRAWLYRLRIPQRFAQPDWSIADKWIAKALLRRGTPAAEVGAILQGGSPGFPRRHADPADYLRRTLARALWELPRTPFPARPSLPRRAGERSADAA